jgi:hypothetical protein
LPNAGHFCKGLALLDKTVFGGTTKLMEQDKDKTNEILSDHESGCQPVYQIEVEGILDDSWSEWFSGLSIENWLTRDGATISRLTGTVADQSTLRGILNKIWDLNLDLVSVVPVPNPGEDKPVVRPAAEGT